MNARERTCTSVLRSNARVHLFISFVLRISCCILVLHQCYTQDCLKFILIRPVEFIYRIVPFLRRLTKRLT